MRIKELADLVGVTPRTIRHYHHEGLLPVPPGDGVRDYGLDHAVRLVCIRHLTESGLSLSAIRGVVDDPSMSPADELALAEEAIDKEMVALARQKKRLRQLRDQADPGTGSDPLADVIPVPSRIAWFYEQVGPRLPDAALPLFEQERRAMEVFFRYPPLARLLEDWLQDFSPERIDATVAIYELFARVPDMPAAETEEAIRGQLAAFRSLFGPDWGFRKSAWSTSIQATLLAPGVLSLLRHTYPDPNHQLFIRLFLSEAAEIMQCHRHPDQVSRETSGVDPL